MFPQIVSFSGILLLATGLLAQDVPQEGPLSPSGDQGGKPLSPSGDQGGTPQPLRMTIPAFGTDAEVEVRDLPPGPGEEAATAALHEIFQLAALSDPDGDAPGGVGALNKMAGQGRQTLDPRIAELLLRSLQFCIWSQGAYGPLGGELYRLWDSQQEERRRPSPTEVRDALGSAECNRVGLPGAGSEGPGTTGQLTAGSRVDLRGIARGFAVDRAIEILVSHGSQNALVEIGNVRRVMGGGPEGEGWLFTLPPAPGMYEPVDQVWLRDQAAVIYQARPEKGEPFQPVIDQRTGVPGRGVITVVTVTIQAVDAEPLASILFIFGHRDGQMRLGTLDPRPAVYWLLGEDVELPLEASYRWSTVEQVRR